MAGRKCLSQAKGREGGGEYGLYIRGCAANCTEIMLFPVDNNLVVFFARIRCWSLPQLGSFQPL